MKKELEEIWQGKIIKNRLSKELCITGNFNTWQYAKTSQQNLFVPLILQLIYKVNDAAEELGIKEEYDAKFKEQDDSMARTVVKGAFSLFTVAAAEHFGFLDTIKDFFGTADKMNSVQIDNDKLDLVDVEVMDMWIVGQDGNYSCKDGNPNFFKVHEDFLEKISLEKFDCY